jgi:hypothetical protein
MRMVELRRENGLVVYGPPYPVIGRFSPLLAGMGLVPLLALFWVPSGPLRALLAALALAITWVFLLRHFLFPRRELWLDSLRHAVTFRRQRPRDRPREEVLTRADVHHVVLALRRTSGPYRLLYLVGAGGRGRQIDRGEELPRMEALAADLQKALAVPLLRFDTDLAGPRLVLETNTQAAAVFRDVRNYERRGVAGSRCGLLGVFLGASCTVLLGTLWAWFASGAPTQTKTLLLVAASAGVTGLAATGVAGLVIVLRSLRVVGVEVRAGPSLVLHVLPFRGPARVETRAGAEVAAVVKVVSRKGLCRQVWLRWADGRKTLLDRLAADMAEAGRKTEDGPQALLDLARQLHERLKVPIQIERRRLTLL